MNRIHVTAKRDFIETLASSRPLPAIAELIWNGFDSGATLVQVFLEENEMSGLHSIRVRDSGSGIDHEKLDALFGGLGESWKKRAARSHGRALHGKNGKGRFKAFALGQQVEWRTTFQKGTDRLTYSITGRGGAIDDFEISDVQSSQTAGLGTEVAVYNLASDLRSLQAENAPLELTKTFAAYLTEYPTLRLEFNGRQIDPSAVMKNQVSYVLAPISLEQGGVANVSMTIIEWTIPSDRIFHLCDGDGIALHEIPVGAKIRAPGMNFSVYLKSEHFRILDAENKLTIADLNPDVQRVVSVASAKVKEHVRKRILENKSQTIERWKKEDIYPFADKADLDPVESAERQVFDILAVNVESYLPAFEESDKKAKKFTFLLLAQAIRENPESVQRIIGEVLGLKKEAQDDLADLLQRTSLSSIISAAKVVSNRLDFLNGLENLIYDKDSKNALLERDQLHKILEREAWIFDESFALAGSEQRLEEVLRKHLGEKLIGDDASAVDVGGGKTGRVDLFLTKTVQPREGEFDHLIVELKRPSKKIDSEVISQIEKYAIAVANDERFQGVKATWTFLAVSNELDPVARRKATQRDLPIGRVYADSDLPITVWVRPWSEIIGNARTKLKFFSEQLGVDATRETATSYLLAAHAKYIPGIESPEDVVE